VLEEANGGGDCDVKGNTRGRVGGGGAMNPRRGKKGRPSRGSVKTPSPEGGSLPPPGGAMSEGKRGDPRRGGIPLVGQKKNHLRPSGPTTKTTANLRKKKKATSMGMGVSQGRKKQGREARSARGARRLVRKRKLTGGPAGKAKSLRAAHMKGDSGIRRRLNSKKSHNAADGGHLLKTMSEGFHRGEKSRAWYKEAVVPKT